ncbi:hypothetical protein [Helicobacter cynogastricus]|uniref:hypothetical protein n=1 Tax=Helicobacter cynogastricus TaxID=329937 RepID=UPI0013154830|nr:hypothetical protein [Helicobacter cynogastricus]
MFQPLLDVFVDSILLPHSQEKKPLKLGISWWHGDTINNFKHWCFDYILNSQYEITYSTHPKEPCDIVIGASFMLEGLNKPILSFPQKRIGYTGENERINFDIYDFGIGFDLLSFHERYLRVPLYYLSLWDRFYESCAHLDSPFQINPQIVPTLKATPTTPFKDNYPHIDALVREQSDLCKRGFASFVASNPNAPMRNACYQELCAYRPVAGGGGCLTRLGNALQTSMNF